MYAIRSYYVTTRIRAARAGVRTTSTSQAKPRVKAARAPNSRWFALNGERIAQGREKASDWLREHPDAVEELVMRLA